MAHILVALAGVERPAWVQALIDDGHEVRVVTAPGQLTRMAHPEDLDVLLVDIRHVLDEPLDIINLLKSANPGLEVVTLTTIDAIRQAAATITRGASLYLVEPVEAEHVRRILKTALAHKGAALVVRGVEDKQMEGFLGSSPAMVRLFAMVRKVAPTDATVLITGESGTGKEVLAQFIHRLSPRSGSGFVAINCAAIPDTLLESELFGHARGAFTGAVADKRGLFEEADGGTAFLDEVAEMAPAVQAKLLRFLQDRTVRRVGGLTSRRVNVRILAATNRNLATEVASGRFREDLFYRLNVIRLEILPLRERRETIPFLTSHILSRLQERYGPHRTIQGISPDAQRLLLGHDYPGNIRELENVLEHAVIMADGPRIEVAHLPVGVTRPRTPLLPATTAAAMDGRIQTLDEVERIYIEDVLRACGGNQSQAARKLGISRTSLWRRLKRPEG